MLSKNLRACLNQFKEAVSRDFRPLFFMDRIETILSPDRQAELVLLKNSFSRRYSNSKIEKFDSAQCDTVRS